MFSRAASTIGRGPAGRALLRRSCAPPRAARQGAAGGQRRNMGGGSHWMEVSDVHTKAGEAFGFVCWIWVFHRARCDGPVVMGWRHPWEHAEDPWVAAGEAEISGNVEEMKADWDAFAQKAIKPGEDDDDDDDDEDDDDDDEE